MNWRNVSVVVLVLVAGSLLITGCSKGGGGRAATAPVVESTMMDGYQQVEHKGYVLKWKVDGDNLDGSVSYATTGWVAVGFAPTDQMKDANIVLGYVADGKAVVADHFGTTKTAHKPDDAVGGSANLVQASATEANGVTEVRFVIPLDSGDGKDAKLVPGETITVILGRGPEGSDNAKTYHGTDGRETIAVKL